MKVTVFTSNQPRHISLIESLAAIADEVFVVQECNTVFPGETEDFYHKTEVMRRYFKKVIEAERLVFDHPRFGSTKSRHLVLKLGDLNKLEIEVLTPALHSDVYIVFGSSFIKGSLCDFLVEHKAFNIHMGTSPYYRGTDCNFWALYDGHPDYVGATIHMLSNGLDSGPMLFHALPKTEEVDSFLLGMLAVKAAHQGLVHYLQTGKIWKMEPVFQDKGREIRYSRKQEFNDEVADEYLEKMPNSKEIYEILKKRDNSKFLHPFTL